MDVLADRRGYDGIGKWGDDEYPNVLLTRRVE